MSSKVIVSFFFFFYLIMPEYFAFEISSKIPLLTASRVLLLLLLIFALYSRNGNLNLKSPSKALSFYLGIMIVVNCFHLFDCFPDSVKRIATIILEQWLLVVLIVQVLNSRKKIEIALEAMVWASGLIGFLAIIETITGVNIFYYLTTTSREMLQSSFVRMGMLRAEGPFGHAVYLGTYCVCMLPFSLFCYETKRKNYYLLIAILNIIGTFASGSRGQILILAVVLMYIFFKKKDSIKVKYIKLVLFVIPIMCLAFLCIPALREMLFNNVKSVLSALGFSYTLTDYGANTSGWASRLWQLSGFLHLYNEKALFFGLGSACHTRGLVEYFWDGVWRQINTFDVGYVGVAMQYGLLGLLGYLTLLGGCLRSGKLLGSKRDINNIHNTFLCFYVAYMLNLLSTVGIENMFFLVLGIHYAYIKVETKQKRLKIETHLV